MEISYSRDQATDALVSVSEAARRLGVTVDTVRRWETSGHIKATRTPGGQRRFSLSEVERVKAGGADR